MIKKIYIIGAGSYGEAIADLAEHCGYQVAGYYDDDESKKETMCMGSKVIGKIEISEEKVQGKLFAIAIGNNKIRESIAKKILDCGGLLPSLVHSTAVISKQVSIGTGCFVHSQSFLWTKVSVADFCIVSPQVVLAHHTEMLQSSFVSAGSNIGANIQIGQRAFIGIGSTLMTGISQIGSDSVVGAGSVVIENVDSGITVVGNPAKQIKKS